MDLLKDLGNTTPSLSLIVSLITGTSIIVTGIICKKHANLTGTTNDNNTCKYVPYVGIAVIVVGIVLFYFAQETDLATYEGLWIILSTIMSMTVWCKVE
jgi:uncharacterized membrane protein HdeD (DUF308 family)